MVSLRFFLFNFLPLIIDAVTLQYSTPVCLSSGGMFTLDCGTVSATSDIHIREVFIGRRTEGMCDWQTGSVSSCEYDPSTDNTDFRDLQYDIIIECDGQRDCDMTIASYNDSFCEGTGYIQAEYYCLESGSGVIGTGFTTITRTGEGLCLESTDEIHSCDGATVKLKDLSVELYSADDCSGTSICDFKSNSAETLVGMLSNCLGEEMCSVGEAIEDDSTGEVLGCSGVQINDANGFLLTSHSVICEGTFDSVEDQITTEDLCIGMPDENVPLYSAGLEEGFKCYLQYLNCMTDQTQGGALSCPIDELFDLVTGQCQDKTSAFCSVPVPINLAAAPVSSTEVTFTWEMPADAADVNVFIVKAETSNDNSDPIEQTGTFEIPFEKSFITLTPNSLYTFSVKGIQDGYESSWAETTGYTYPHEPEVSVDGTTTDSVMFQATFNSQKADYVKFVQTLPTGSTEEHIMNDSGDFEIDGLESATIYKFEATYWGTDSGLNSGSQELTAVTKPSPVTNLVVENGGTTDTLTLTWEYTGNFHEFEVTVKDSDNAEVSSNDVAEKTLTIDENLTPGETYTVEVTVVFEDERSELETESEQLFPHPGSITITDKSDTSLTVSMSFEGVADTLELQLLSNNNLLDEQEIQATSESFVFEDLDPATAYEITLRVVKGELSSQTPRSSTGSEFTAPSVTSSADTEPESSSSASISWEEEASAERFYITYRPEGASQTEVFYSDEPNANLTDLQAATVYIVNIFSEANGIRSEGREIEVFTLPNDPTNLEVTPIDETSVTLTWLHIGNADSFFVEIENLDDPDDSYSLTTENKEIKLTDLAIGADYEFKVWATFRTYNSENAAIQVFEVPCALKQDAWNDGKHGKWMIFLIVYSIVITILFILALIAFGVTYKRSNWRPAKSFQSQANIYNVSERSEPTTYDNYKHKESTAFAHPPGFPPPSYLGPEQSTRIDDAIPKPQPRRTKSESSDFSAQDATIEAEFETNDSYAHEF